ncbi:MAG: tungstate ABC transporter ATP-binding protein WtpC [Halobacteriota archaeon]|nr:tungstate ABC transporter ATP-binding protein WtpC [Halobacteriota archaeon]
MIRIKDLYRSWKQFSLEEINLEIGAGEYFVILGPTGAGKTLLLELIAGFYRPERGEIWINGEDVSALPPEERGLGFVYQDYSLFPHLTVRENIEFGLRVKKVAKEEIERQSESMMDLLGIAHLKDRHPNTLSGGEQQKTAIARALILKPKILLLDEPLSALDARTKAVMQEELRLIHKNSDITIVHVTHDQTEAMILAGKIGVMMGGRIVQTGTVREIFNRPKDREIADFVGVENVLDGVVKGDEYGVAIIDVGHFEICSVSSVSSERGKVHVFIRPEDIVLSKKSQKTSARNNIKSKIAKVTNLGAIAKIELDCGLIAFTTKRSVEDIGLDEGEDVYASFKATAVHVVATF